MQIMSIEDVERIMDETKEGIEYQRVGSSTLPPHLNYNCREGRAGKESWNFSTFLRELTIGGLTPW